MFTPADIMQQLAIRVARPESPGAEIGATVRFDILGEHESSWVLQLVRARSVTAVPASSTPPVDCTFRLDGADFVRLCSGKVTGQQLFFDGRLQIDGDLTLTLKLPAITRLLSPRDSQP